MGESLVKNASSHLKSLDQMASNFTFCQSGSHSDGRSMKEVKEKKEEVFQQHLTPKA